MESNERLNFENSRKESGKFMRSIQGPWRARTEGLADPASAFDQERISVLGPKDENGFDPIIADVIIHDDAAAAVNAAKLISAAPELLDACEAALMELRLGDGTHSKEIQDQLFKAIIRARV